MRSDREWLEAAAQAAGMVVLVAPWDRATQSGWFWCDHGRNGAGLYEFEGRGFWNPLIDDGDAFRLAVQLGFINPGQWPNPALLVAQQVAQNQAVDWVSASRWAVVMAAAQRFQPLQPLKLRQAAAA